MVLRYEFRRLKATDLLEPRGRAFGALARRVDYQKASEFGQTKRPMRVILRQPNPELDVELALKPTGKNLIGSKLKFAKFWIISESHDGTFIARILKNVPANFLSRNGLRAMAGCGQKSR
jgi:hypothetical protein